MPQAKKTKQPSRTTAVAQTRAEGDAQRLDRITQTLEVAQKDLASIGGSVGTGVRDLRRDVTKLLRDARRDLAKMRRAIQPRYGPPPEGCGLGGIARRQQTGAGEGQRPSAGNSERAKAAR